MEINEDRTKRRKLTIETSKQTYFDSTEAEMLFKPTEKKLSSMLSTDESILEFLYRIRFSFFV
jgi:hypothetical protein